jgi:hypothetical protein
MSSVENGSEIVGADIESLSSQIQLQKRFKSKDFRSAEQMH